MSLNQLTMLGQFSQRQQNLIDVIFFVCQTNSLIKFIQKFEINQDYVQLLKQILQMIKNFNQKLFSSQNVFRIGLVSKISQSYSCQLLCEKSYINKLESRSLLVMHRSKTYKLLQGLIKNDADLFLSSPKQSKENSNQPLIKIQNQHFPQTGRVSLYTLFLSSMVKLFVQTFLYKSRAFFNGNKEFKQDQLWMNVRFSAKKELPFHLKNYKQKKFQFKGFGFNKSHYLGQKVIAHSYSTGKVDKNNLSKKQIPIVLLSNQKVVLTPLVQNDFERLFKVASDPLIWEQHPNPDRYKREVFQKYFEGAIQSQGAFIISDAVSGNVIGCSRFYDFDSEARLIKIGYTFFSRESWGGTFNQAVKSLMLNYVFSIVEKVHFEIGGKNIRSQKAIERIGAQKIDEKVLAYYGEPPQVNFIYEIKK